MKTDKKRPAPGAALRDSLRRRFVEELRKRRTIAAAARVCAISSATAYRWYGELYEQIKAQEDARDEAKEALRVLVRSEQTPPLVRLKAALGTLNIEDSRLSIRSLDLAQADRDAFGRLLDSMRKQAGLPADTGDGQGEGEGA
jgi:hypothetical protein